MVLEGDNSSFEESYDILAGEKAYLEDKVGSLDGSVEHFSQSIEVLVEEKKAFEDQVDRANMQFGEEVARRRSMEDNLGWLIHKGIVHVVDKVVECSKFVIGVKWMKMACMAAGIENGKQEVRKQVITGKFVPRDAVATTDHIHAMYAAVEAFMETNFVSYLHLGELDMAGLR